VMDGVDETPNLSLRTGADGIAYARWAPQGTLIKLN